MINLEIDKDGNKSWYKNSKRHREDGPAYIGFDGYQLWFIDGLRHKTDGPGEINQDGSYYFWVNGKFYTHNKAFQLAAGISDEDMLAMILKYGDVK
jgi:hypothetical protein